MGMPPLTALFAPILIGPWPISRVHTRWGAAHELTYAPDAVAAIAATWDAQVASAASQQRLLFNGTLAHVLHVVLTPGGGCVVEIQPTDYRTFVGTRTSAFRVACASDTPAEPLSLWGAPRTTDGWLVFNPRTGQDLYNASLGIIGGFLDPTVDRNPAGNPNLARSLAREIREELGIIAPVQDMQALGLARDLTTPHWGLAFSTVLPTTKAELERKVRAGETDGEIQTLFFAEDSAEGLAALLSGATAHPLSPAAAAAWSMYGLITYGADWARVTLGEGLTARLLAVHIADTAV